MTDALSLAPATKASGTISLPGSKSISNRTLLLAALSTGDTLIHDLLDADDVSRMLEALAALGVSVETTGDSSRIVRGTGGRFPVTEADLFLGNAGTAIRPLTAALALMGGHYRLSGVPRMHERPIGDLVDALRQLGATIEYRGKPGFPPLEVLRAPGSGLQASGTEGTARHAPTDAEQTRQSPTPDAGQVSVRGNVSSQFLTALLMAAPLTGADLRIDVIGELISKPYIDITISLMARFGVQVTRTADGAFVVPAGSRYVSPGTIHVEGDASSASYFLAAGAIGGGPVRVTGVGADSIQGDVKFADALARFGARLTMGEHWIEASAPASGRLQGIDIDCNEIPDAAMTLAVVALFAEGETTLRNIASWRVKETDRLAAMATELRKVGAVIDERPDALRITPPPRLTPNATIDTYDDHRMAMCFSLVSLGGVPVTINDPGCVAKTFPDYFDRLASIVYRMGG